MKTEILVSANRREKQKREWVVLSKQKPNRMVKIDSYEYDSLAEDILQDKISFKSLIEIFNDKIYWKWFYKHHIQSQKVFIAAKIKT